MGLSIVGAGLPRTATASQRVALEHLLRGPCCHMSAIPNHPFNLGVAWQTALAGKSVDWSSLMDGFVAAVDWPASMFWRELSTAYPGALVLLSVRESAQTWHQSMAATVLPVARAALAPDWTGGRDLLTLLERFTGSSQWDNPATLMSAYERHNATVRRSLPPDRLLEWRAQDGWSPICHRLGLPVPEVPFPWTNRREDWK
jgi:hypothetical protein